jgi:protein-tyrosine phosphatase
MRILFVCLGNICRSPAAEGVFKHMIAESGLEREIFCDSAGTAGYHEGEGAYPKMKKIAFKRGYDLTSISRKIRPASDFDEFDLIIGMDDQNVADLTRMAPDAKAKAKIRKMTDYCTRLRHSSVPDPYYGDSSDYELVIDILEDACAGLLESLNSSDHL